MCTFVCVHGRHEGGNKGWVRLAQIMMEAGLKKVKNAYLLSPRKLPLLNRIPSSGVCDVLMVAFHKISVRNAKSEEPAGLVSRFWPPPPSPTLRVNLSEA